MPREVELRTTNEPGLPGDVLGTSLVEVSSASFVEGRALFDAVVLHGGVDYYVAVTPTDSAEGQTIRWRWNDEGTEALSSYREGLTGFQWTGPWLNVEPEYRVEGTPVCGSDITGPVGPGNADGHVNHLDFLLLSSQWGSPCTVGGCEGDITGPAGPDGNVDALDFLLLNAQFGSPGYCPIDP